MRIARLWIQHCLILFILALPVAGKAQEQEAVSLLKTPLIRPVLDPKTESEFNQKLADAKVAFEKDPKNINAIIWFGRRTAYLGRYREAIAIYTRGIQFHPQEPQLYRHRGHRYLSVREIDRAVADFEKAAQLIEDKPDQVEPDGLPNAKNIPTSTLNTNIYYHLGLAYYLKREFEKAEQAYQKCMKFTKNDDMLVAVTHWRYMNFRRQGKKTEAEQLLKPIHEDMNIIEDFDYYALTLMYKGLKTPADLDQQQKSSGGISGPTLGYGMGNWYLYNGQKEKALDLFRTILSNTNEWGAFGYLAAEAELCDLNSQKRRPDSELRRQNP